MTTSIIVIIKLLNHYTFSYRKWNNENDPCLHCPGKYLDQTHFLNCQYLLGKNKILSYIPGSRDIFNESLEEQVYSSRVMKENHTLLRAQQRTMWTGAGPMFYYNIFVIVMDLQ